MIRFEAQNGDHEDVMVPEDEEVEEVSSETENAF